MCENETKCYPPAQEGRRALDEHHCNHLGERGPARHLCTPRPRWGSEGMRNQTAAARGWCAVEPRSPHAQKGAPEPFATAKKSAGALEGPKGRQDPPRAAAKGASVEPGRRTLEQNR